MKYQVTLTIKEARIEKTTNQQGSIIVEITGAIMDMTVIQLRKTEITIGTEKELNIFNANKPIILEIILVLDINNTKKEREKIC